MNYWTQSKNNIYVAAHRGWPAKYPENTMAGFEAALELGVDQIETDIRVSKDGELVLIHDNTVDRTTNGSGKVMGMTFAQLRELDAGNGEKISTLKELMELVKTCTNGSSELLTNLSLSIVNMLYNAKLMQYAGENGVAAYGVIMYVNFIFISAVISFLRTLLFQVIAVMFLPIIFGINGIWISITVAELLALAVSAICFVTNRKKYGY